MQCFYDRIYEYLTRISISLNFRIIRVITVASPISPPTKPLQLSCQLFGRILGIE